MARTRDATYDETVGRGHNAVSGMLSTGMMRAGRLSNRFLAMHLVQVRGSRRVGSTTPSGTI
ncbi:MAG TPA: hypothetical protein VIU62_02725 [Chloroflexota bacterium]